jgi:predicted RNA binding protein YcfA (HicA-like mRNA interferase family)
MSGKQLLKRLRDDGWELDRVSGSHYIMKKGDKTLSVPYHGDKPIPTGLLEKLLKQAGLK